ncbi:MAG: T9SS type A sorting domain-containing protein [Ferruginibacter sp.]
MKKLHIALFAILISTKLLAQYPSGCGSVSARNNSNGQANNCAAASGTPVAANFVGTPYASLPAGAKTADITFKYLGTDYTTLKPYAITEISVTSGGITTIINSPVGPAAVPTLTGSNDALVKYCVYITNIPTSGTLNFKLVNPETGAVYGSCFYDAACNANCNSTGSTLPIDFLSLKGRKTTAGILLEWTTTNEINTQKFEIEKSQDGQRFAKIDEKPAIGSGSSNYSYADNQLNTVANYYRIKTLNIDGSFQYSNIIQVKDAAVFSVTKIQPNPFVSEIIIDANLEKTATCFIQILDLNGKEVIRKQVITTVGNNRITVDGLSKLNKGIYVIKISCDNGSWQQKLIK